MFPHEAALSYDLGTVVKNAIEPGVATATFAMVMNPAKYDSLPADLKAVIDKTTGMAGATEFGKMWADAEKVGRDKEISQGVQMLKLSDADITKMKEMMAPHVKSAIEAVDKDGKEGSKFFAEYTK